MGLINEILIRIGLEGDEDIKKKLDNILGHGQKFGQDISKSINQAVQTNPALGKGFGAEEGIERSREAAERFREVIHTLHPVLGAAGLEIANLGGYARLAGAGMGALGVAIAGSVLVGLAKIGEESERAGLRLKALGVSGDTFEKLKQQAAELGTSTENLIPSLEKFAAAKNKINADRSSGLIRLRPNGLTEADEAAAGVRVLGTRGQETGAQVPDSVFLGAQKALIEGAQGEKISGDEAGKIADAFATKLLENRKLTPEAVDVLNPASQNNLAKSLSSFFGTDLANGAELKERLSRPGQQAPSDSEVFRSLNNAEPAARAQAEAAQGVTAAFDSLIASTKRLAEEFSGDIGLAGAIKQLADLINSVADNAAKTLHPRDFEPGGPKFIGPVSQDEKKEYNKPDILDVGKALITGKADERFKDSNAIKAAKALFNYNPADAKPPGVAEPIPPLSFARPEFSAKPETVPVPPTSTSAPQPVHAPVAVAPISPAATPEPASVPTGGGAEVPVAAPVAAPPVAPAPQISAPSPVTDGPRSEAAPVQPINPGISPTKSHETRPDAASSAATSKVTSLIETVTSVLSKATAAVPPATPTASPVSAATTVLPAIIPQPGPLAPEARAAEAPTLAVPAPASAASPVPRSAATSPAAPASPDNAANGPRADLGTATESRLAADFGAISPAAAAEAPAPAVPAIPAAKPEFEYIPPPKNEFQYIPPPKEEQQYIPPPREQQQYIKPQSSNGQRGDVSPVVSAISQATTSPPAPAIPAPVVAATTAASPAAPVAPIATLPATAVASPVSPPQATPGAVTPPSAPATTGPLSEAPAPAQPPQQVAGLGSEVEQIVRSISAAINGAPKDTHIDNPVTIGVRGEAAPVGDDTTRKVADLGTAAAEAAAKLRGVEVPSSSGAATTEPPVAHAAEGGSIIGMADGGEARLNVSPGGHLSGPGTGKSDSIKADVANGEFVVNAEDTARNLPLLHDINSGKVRDGHYVAGGRASPGYDGTHFANGGEARFADGGTVSAHSADLTPGQHDITDDGAGGAIIDGISYPKGSPILQNPIVQQGIAASLKPQQPQHKKKHHSVFHPDNEGAGYGPSGESAAFAPGAGAGSGFADGGLVGRFADGGRVGSSSPSTETRFREVVNQFAKGGVVWSWPASKSQPTAGHFAQGGPIGRDSAISDFRDRISHYAEGGTISIPHFDLGLPDLKSPSIASDSSALKSEQGTGPLHPVTLNLPGGGSIDGFHAQPSAVSQLRNEANKARRFSTGSKPSWYGGGGQ